MIFDIILQAKKLIFWFCSDRNFFFGTQKLMTYSKFQFGAKLEWSRSQQNLDQKEPKSEP